MEALIMLSGTGYDHLYLGYAKDVEDNQDQWIKWKDEIPYTTADGQEKTGRTYVIPVSALDQAIPVTVYSKTKKQWFERTITLKSEGMKKVETEEVNPGPSTAPTETPTSPTTPAPSTAPSQPARPAGVPADGVYTTTISTGAEMFRVVTTILTVKNGKMSAEITLSGIGYDYLYMGTAAEAAGNESQWIGCKDEQKSYIENGEEKAFMMRAFDNANRAVYEKATSDPEVLGMGTTGVCALQRGNLAHIVHAGDSRAYLWHGGAIRQLTRDHSMVQQLVDSGQITREQAALHPQKNLITRALGVSANIVPEYNLSLIHI